MAGDEHLERFVKDTRSPLARLLGDGAAPAHRAFAFDGAGGRFAGATWAVRAVDAATQVRAVVDAVKYLTKECGWERDDLYSELGERVLDLESKVRVLAAALVRPEAPAEPLASGPDEVRRLEADEIEAIWEHFAEFQDERSPLSKVRSWEEVEALVVALGKGFKSRTSLSSYGSATLRSMLLTLAPRYVALMRPPFSGTTPPSGSSAGSTDPTASAT